MNHQSDLQHPAPSGVSGQRVAVQDVASHQVVQNQPQHAQGGQHVIVDGMLQNMMVEQRQEQQKVVLVTMPEGIGGSGEGDVEIIVTTHLSPAEDESMYVLHNSDTQYQQLENASVANMDLPQSVSDYNTSVLNPHQGHGTVQMNNAGHGGVNMTSGTQTSFQQPCHSGQIHSYQPVNTTANAIYNSAISSGIIPSTQTNTPGAVYSSAVSSAIDSSAFQSTANTHPQQMISLSRFPGNLDQGSSNGSAGAVPLQIASMPNSGTPVPDHQTSIAQGAGVQTPETSSMTPEERDLYEKQETMKSLELVEAQWKSSIAELSPKAPECVMFPTEEEDEEEGVEGDKAVFAYKVVDINADSELQEEEAQQDAKESKMDTENQSVQDHQEPSGGSREENESNNIKTEMDFEDNQDKVVDDIMCTICQKMFNDIDKLQSHVRSHCKGQPYPCSKCKLTFIDANSLERHQAMHSDSLTCENCNKTFTTTAYLKSHMRTHTGEKIHVCDLCDESFVFSNMLRRHKMKYHKEVIKTCDICSKDFVSTLLLKRHLQEHKSGTQVAAVQSGRKKKSPRGRKSKAKKVKKTTKTTTAQTKVKLPAAGTRPQTRGQKKKQAAEKAGKVDKRKHESPKQRVFKCMICQEKFKSKIQLKKHAKKHLGQRILRCDKCGKVFQDSIKLKMHKLTHSGQSFDCHFCGKSFTYASTLIMHKKSHLKEKGFQCKTCGKRFASMDLLKTHKATHPVTKAFVCDICEKAFTSQYYLKAHKRLHTGEKHYGCLQCGESFMFSTGLRRHVIKAHGGTTGKRRRSVRAKENSSMLASDSDAEAEYDKDDQDFEPLSIDQGEESNPETMKMKFDKNLVIEIMKDEDGMLQCQCCQKKFQSTPALNTHMKEHVEFPHTCDICEKTFSRKLYLQKHLQRHNDERPFHCAVCKKSFRSATYLEQHRQIHTGEKSYQCQLCGQEFIFANSLRRHLKTHDDIGPNMQGLVRKKKKGKNYRPVSEFSPEKVSQLTCHLCGYTFQTVSQLDEHVKNHSGENPVYECSVCKKEFNSHRALWRHRQIHVDDQPIVCKVCNKTFRSGYYLKSHMNLHNGKKPYKCKHCDMTFVYASTRRRHQRTHTPEESMNFMCSICGKKFFEQGEFDRHIIGHSGEKPFMCDVCGKTFATKALLRSHINRHNGERQYKCPMCNKMFLYRYRLQRHINTHSAVKSFTCNVCGKGFLTQAYLSTHLRFHTGEKPYKCEVCAEEFSFSNTFRRHKRIHTGQTLNCGVCGKMCLELFDLKRHMQSHSDQKTVMCDICGKTFSHQGSCKRHMRRIHPEAVMPFQVQESINVQVSDTINVEIQV